MPRKESDARPSSSSGRKTSPPGDSEDTKRQTATIIQNLQRRISIMKDNLEEMKRNDQQIKGLREHMNGLQQEMEKTSGDTKTSESLATAIPPDEMNERTKDDANDFVDASNRILENIALALAAGSESELKKCHRELEVLNQKMAALQSDSSKTN